MSEETKKSGGGCFKYLFWLVVVFIFAGVIGGLGFLYITERLTKDAFMEMVEVFKPKTVINSFAEWRDLQVKGNDGNILEVATATANEQLTRESSVEMFGKIIPIITTTSQISVPATYRYHIDLKGKWVMEQTENRLLVKAPPVQPSLPVAFDTSKMQKKNPEGWAKYLAGSNMAELEKTITSELEKRAKDPETIKEIEKEAKHSIAKFLQTWLVGEDQWAQGKFEEIVVYFDGEIMDKYDQNATPDLRINQPAL